jgi:predicted  nucleic acid-binding Zn-ribbon protein
VEPGEDIQELMSQKRALQSERDTLMEQVVRMRTEMTDLSTRLQDVEGAHKRGEESIVELREQITAKKNEADHEARKKANLERQLTSLKRELDQKQQVGEASEYTLLALMHTPRARTHSSRSYTPLTLMHTPRAHAHSLHEHHKQDVGEKQKQVEVVQEELSGMSEQVKSKNLELEKVRTELAALSRRNDQQEKQVEEAAYASKIANEEAARLRQEAKTLETESAVQKEEIAKLQKLNEGIQKKLRGECFSLEATPLLSPPRTSIHPHRLPPPQSLRRRSSR